MIQMMNRVNRKNFKLYQIDRTKFVVKFVTETVVYCEQNDISWNDFMDILIKLKNESTTA